MLNVDDAPVSHPVMVRAKCYQVEEIISATVTPGCDVVDIGGHVEPADDAAMFVSLTNLFPDELPLAAFPVAGIDAGKQGSVVPTVAEPIAIVVFVDLARIKA